MPVNSNQLVFSPSEFVYIFNQSIDYAFPNVVIEGEIVSFKISKNRWVYFDIKDEESSIRCFGTVYGLPGPLEGGMLVKIVSQPKLHQIFGFSLNFSSITPVGEGSILKQVDLLKLKLEKEGLFEPSRKRQIIYPPNRVALITSVESAAYADFVKITKNRWPLMQIDVYDVQVQGLTATNQICDAIKLANNSTYDCIVITRGGGSIDDLAVFNDEKLVRSVYESRTPTLIAIGHEIDESLCELVSDLRASTPSNAAELLVPTIESVQTEIYSLKSIIKNQVFSLVRSEIDRCQYLEHNLGLRLKSTLNREETYLVNILDRLKSYNPREVLRWGYSLVKLNNQMVKHGSELEVGDKVDIIFTDVIRNATIND